MLSSSSSSSCSSSSSTLPSSTFQLHLGELQKHYNMVQEENVILKQLIQSLQAEISFLKRKVRSTTEEKKRKKTDTDEEEEQQTGQEEHLESEVNQHAKRSRVRLEEEERNNTESKEERKEAREEEVNVDAQHSVLVATAKEGKRQGGKGRRYVQAGEEEDSRAVEAEDGIRRNLLDFNSKEVEGRRRKKIEVGEGATISKVASFDGKERCENKINRDPISAFSSWSSSTRTTVKESSLGAADALLAEMHVQANAALTSILSQHPLVPSPHSSLVFSSLAPNSLPSSSSTATNAIDFESLKTKYESRKLMLQRLVDQCRIARDKGNELFNQELCLEAYDEYNKCVRKIELALNSCKEDEDQQSVPHSESLAAIKQEIEDLSKNIKSSQSVILSSLLTVCLKLYKIRKSASSTSPVSSVQITLSSLRAQAEHLRQTASHWYRSYVLAAQIYETVDDAEFEGKEQDARNRLLKALDLFDQALARCSQSKDLTSVKKKREVCFKRLKRVEAARTEESDNRQRQKKKHILHQDVPHSISCAIPANEIISSSSSSSTSALLSTALPLSSAQNVLVFQE